MPADVCHSWGLDLTFYFHSPAILLLFTLRKEYGADIGPNLPPHTHSLLLHTHSLLLHTHSLLLLSILDYWLLWEESLGLAFDRGRKACSQAGRGPKRWICSKLGTMSAVKSTHKHRDTHEQKIRYWERVCVYTHILVWRHIHRSMRTQTY